MPITEAEIRSLATAQSYERGEDYYYTRAVADLQKRGDMVTADVSGSSYEPYHVTIEVGEDEIISTSCTCPYDWGGICKHIVAVLLSYVHQPEQVDKRPSVQELIANVNEADLREVLSDLLIAEPHLIDRVEAKLETLALTKTKGKTLKKGKPKTSATSRPASIKGDSFRKQAQQVLRSFGYRNAYESGYDLANQMTNLLNKAKPLLDAGDGRNALLLLEAVMEPFIDCWYDYDYEGEVGEVFIETEALFTEAILCADLSKQDRQEWKETLKRWQADISDYGIDAFDAAIAAAEQRWEYPPLQAVLQGNITNKRTWEGEAPDYADDLAIARLNVSERQGRTQEYLYLAEAEGQTSRYLTMLVKLDRGKEAVQYARQYAGTTDEAFILAKALYEHEQPEEAFEIAEHGLTLEGSKVALTRWLRDTAGTLCKPDVALRAAREAFAATLSMSDYLAAAAVAGSEWESVKPELLAQLKGARNAYEKIDIYLHERMLKEAMQAVDSQKYTDYHTDQKVVDVVWESNPKWTIRHCKQQAEPIMDAGQSQYYHHAVRWLEKAGKAYRTMKKEKEWQEYLNGLIQKHARKSSLRPQLEALRRHKNLRSR